MFFAGLFGSAIHFWASWVTERCEEGVGSLNGWGRETCLGFPVELSLVPKDLQRFQKSDQGFSFACGHLLDCLT